MAPFALRSQSERRFAQQSEQPAPQVGGFTLELFSGSGSSAPIPEGAINEVAAIAAHSTSPPTTTPSSSDPPSATDLSSTSSSIPKLSGTAAALAGVLTFLGVGVFLIGGWKFYLWRRGRNSPGSLRTARRGSWPSDFEKKFDIDGKSNFSQNQKAILFPKIPRSPSATWAPAKLSPWIDPKFPRQPPLALSRGVDSTNSHFDDSIYNVVRGPIVGIRTPPPSYGQLSSSNQLPQDHSLRKPPRPQLLPITVPSLRPADSLSVVENAGRLSLFDEALLARAGRISHTIFPTREALSKEYIPQGRPGDGGKSTDFSPSSGSAHQSIFIPFHDYMTVENSSSDISNPSGLQPVQLPQSDFVIHHGEETRQLGLEATASMEMRSPRRESSLSPQSCNFRSPAPGLPRLVTVAYTFPVSLHDELAVKAGDTLRLLHEFKDGWTLCQRVGRTDAEMGAVPKCCLAERPSVRETISFGKRQDQDGRPFLHLLDKHSFSASQIPSTETSKCASVLISSPPVKRTASFIIGVFHRQSGAIRA